MFFIPIFEYIQAYKMVHVIAVSDKVVCLLHERYFYECAGQKDEFYRYCLYISMFLIFLYILITVYNLIWY